jgi:hypothetical protein
MPSNVLAPNSAPFPEDSEEDALISPHVPFAAAPLGARHPLAVVWDAIKRHLDDRDEHGTRCCRPMRVAPTPEPEVDPLPGREAQGRIAVLPVSEWPLMIEEHRHVRSKRWLRKGEVKARR